MSTEKTAPDAPTEWWDARVDCRGTGCAVRGNVRALLDRPHGDVRAVHSASALRAMGAREKKCAVRFTATWCAPCARFAPKFTALAREFDDVAFATVDVDARAEDALEAFHIETVPTCVLVRDGREVCRVVGVAHHRPARAIARAIKEHLLV